MELCSERGLNLGDTLWPDEWANRHCAFSSFASL